MNLSKSKKLDNKNDPKKTRPSNSLPLIQSSSNKSIQTPTTCSSEVFSSFVDSLKFPRLKPSNHKKQALIRSSTLNMPIFPVPTVNLNNFGAVKAYAACTTPGLKRGKNEDRVKIILNLKKPENFTEKWPKSSYFALFDGERGASCAEFMKEKLHDQIFKDNFFPYYPKKALISAFNLADQEFLDHAEENNDFSGCSALVILFFANRCFIANLGDSLAILSMNMGEKVVQLNSTHTSDNDQEKLRVEQEGAKFFTNYRIEAGVRYEEGQSRVLPGNLAVTRTFGHFYAKSEKYGGNDKIFLSTPEVMNFKVLDNFDFILLVSSGFAALGANEIVEKFWEGFLQSEGDFSCRIENSIHFLLRYACSMMCDENLSVAVICFQSFVNCEKN